MKQPLTKKQFQTLQYLHRFSAKYGFMPSFREIGKHFRITSVNSVWGRICALEKKGWIKRRKYYKRWIIINQ